MRGSGEPTARGAVVEWGRSIREASCCGAARRGGRSSALLVARAIAVRSARSVRAGSQHNAARSLIPPGRDCQRRRPHQGRRPPTAQRASTRAKLAKSAAIIAGNYRQRGAPRAAARFTSEPARGAPKNSSLFQYQHKLRMRQHRHVGQTANAGPPSPPAQLSKTCEIRGNRPDSRSGLRYRPASSRGLGFPGKTQIGQCWQAPQTRRLPPLAA
jgi:hypothetical protein